MLHDTREHAVLVRQLAQRLVQPVTDPRVQVVVDRLPARPLGNEEGVVHVRVFGGLLDLLGRCTVRDLSRDETLALVFEDVGATLEEEHAEDEVAKLGMVHLAAKDVGRAVEMALKLGKGEFCHAGRVPVLLIAFP